MGSAVLQELALSPHAGAFLVSLYLCGFSLGTPGPSWSSETRVWFLAVGLSALEWLSVSLR